MRLFVFQLPGTFFCCFFLVGVFGVVYGPFQAQGFAVLLVAVGHPMTKCCIFCCYLMKFYLCLVLDHKVTVDFGLLVVAELMMWMF